MNEQILTVGQVLEYENLNIPLYQRNYEWKSSSHTNDNSDYTKNLLVDKLLDDIYKVYKENKIYRLGTIILHNNNESMDIVDGKQRIVTLTLLVKCIESEIGHNLISVCNSLLETKVYSNIEKANINSSINNIKRWIRFIKNKNRSADLEKIVVDTIKNKLQFLVITVNDLDEAFQVFDSRNTTGKPLNPIDILKAFHIGEIEKQNRSFQLHPNIDNISNNWNKHESEINDLFSKYLFPIMKWLNKENYEKFEINHIDYFKGITCDLRNNGYNYVRTLRNHFEIGVPYYSGTEFFDMINNYLKKLDEIRKKVSKFDKKLYNDILEKVLYNKNLSNDDLKYSCELFMCALLYYYDRFNMLEDYVMRKIFCWAFMLKIDLKQVNMSSINKYALGIRSESRYKYEIPMFDVIKKCVYADDINKYFDETVDFEGKRIDFESEGIEYDNIYEYILNEIIEKCKKIECGGNCESKR